MNPITALFRRFDRKPLQNPDGFREALKALPRAVERSYDPLQHKTISDLVHLVRHELDLYEEGEETDIRSWKQAAVCLAYLKKFGPFKNPPGPAGEDDLSEFLRDLSATMDLKNWPEGTWIRFGRDEGMDEREIVDFIEQAAGWVEDTTDGGRKAPERSAWASLR